jgi:transcriptional regulator with XRE-family HTH domain
VDCRERFASNLREQRRAQGMTQEELAYAAGLHRTAVSLLEQRRRDPRLSTLAKLAYGLDTTPQQLLHGVSGELHPREVDTPPEPGRKSRGLVAG